MDRITLTPTDFVAILNQTLDYSFGTIEIIGEIANFQIRKNKWLFFDIKDEFASVRCFGTVYMLPGPLEDGLVVRVVARPQLHPQFNFSLSLQNITVAGEGSIKKAADLLAAKLEKEGIFDQERKKRLPYPPKRIGLIASGESAAFGDFIKIINHRWPALEIQLYDVQVQGEKAAPQIIEALHYFNERSLHQVDAIVVTRGGGSADDLVSFNDEKLVRAIAASNVPTLVAIGHEMDITLAELAADVRASTPSNAAEMLTPSLTAEQAYLSSLRSSLGSLLIANFTEERQSLRAMMDRIVGVVERDITNEKSMLHIQRALIEALHPARSLGRGFALVRKEGKVVSSRATLSSGDQISIEFSDGDIRAVIP